MNWEKFRGASRWTMLVAVACVMIMMLPNASALNNPSEIYVDVNDLYDNPYTETWTSSTSVQVNFTDVAKDTIIVAKFTNGTGAAIELFVYDVGTDNFGYIETKATYFVFTVHDLPDGDPQMTFTSQPNMEMTLFAIRNGESFEVENECVVKGRLYEDRYKDHTAKVSFPTHGVSREAVINNTETSDMTYMLLVGGSIYVRETLSDGISPAESLKQGDSEIILQSSADLKFGIDISQGVAATSAPLGQGDLPAPFTNYEVSPGSGEAKQPVIDIDSDNNPHMVWVETKNGVESINYSYSTGFDASGSPIWSAPVEIVSGYENIRDLAFSVNDKDMHLLFVRDSDPSSDPVPSYAPPLVMYMQYDYSTGQWSSPENIARGDKPQIYTSVSDTFPYFDGYTVMDETFITYQSKYQDPKYLDHAGTPVYFAYKWNEEDTWYHTDLYYSDPSQSSAPAIAVDLQYTDTSWDHFIHLAWVRYGAINYAYSTDWGWTWSPSAFPYDELRGLSRTIIKDSLQMVAKDGVVHLFFTDKNYANDYETHHYIGTYDGSGFTWEENELPSKAGDAMYPSVDIDSSGNVHMTWQDTRDMNREIYYMKLDPQGKALEQNRITDDAAYSERPSVAVDGNDALHISWQDDRSGDWDIYYAGVGTAVLGATPPTTSSASPNPGEEVIISSEVYNNGDGDAEDVYASFYMYSEETHLETIHIPVIPAHSYVTVSTTWIAEPGTHTAKIYLDYNGDKSDGIAAESEVKPTKFFYSFESLSP